MFEKNALPAGQLCPADRVPLRSAIGIAVARRNGQAGEININSFPSQIRYVR